MSVSVPVRTFDIGMFTINTDSSAKVFDFRNHTKVPKSQHRMHVGLGLGVQESRGSDPSPAGREVT